MQWNILCNEKEPLGRALTGRGERKPSRGLEMVYILIWLEMTWEYKYSQTLVSCTLKICVIYVCCKLFCLSAD